MLRIISKHLLFSYFPSTRIRLWFTPLEPWWKNFQVSKRAYSHRRRGYPTKNPLFTKLFVPLRTKFFPSEPDFQRDFRSDLPRTPMPTVILTLAGSLINLERGKEIHYLQGAEIHQDPDI